MLGAMFVFQVGRSKFSVAGDQLAVYPSSQFSVSSRQLVIRSLVDEFFGQRQELEQAFVNLFQCLDPFLKHLLFFKGYGPRLDVLL